jgi:hypothetical protein
MTMLQDHSHLNRAHAECRTQDSEFSRPQILGARILVTTVGRDEEVIRAYNSTGRPPLGSARTKDLSRPKSNQSSQHSSKPPLAVPNQTSSFAGGYWLVAQRSDLYDFGLSA